jgi:acyl carrier protein
MGLDVVELVMRTEEVFDITIPDEDAERASTVGKLYEIICARLSLPPSPIRPTGTAAPRSLNPTLNPSPNPWTREEVWSTLVAIVIDQLQVDEQDVRYDARWGEDLRAD